MDVEPTSSGNQGEEKGQLLEEGKARVHYNADEVFYNPIQEFNRDLSILMIQQHINQLEEAKKSTTTKSSKTSKSDKGALPKPTGINIFEGLSATGLRSIRYWKEIQGVNSILVNDLEPAAVETIRKNLEFNEIDTTKCIPNQGDCSMVLYNRSRDKTQPNFDVVDIDPYGSASQFLDAAVQGVADGGLICVTCTDLAVLCGSHPETCYAKYQAIPLKGFHCHEFALRIVLANIQAHAIRYKRYIKPILSIYVDFYVRIFVRVFESPHESKLAFANTGMAFQCVGCKSFWTSAWGEVITDPRTNYRKYKMKIGPTVPSACTFCGQQVKMGGPLWLAPIQDTKSVNEIVATLKKPETKEKFKTHKRLLGLLSLVSEEIPEAPLFYLHSALCHVLKLTNPPLIGVRSAIKAAGYRVSGSHCDANAIKTDAPNEVLWDILRCWHVLHPANLVKHSADSPTVKILSVPPTIQADFTKRKDAESDARNLPRFIHQPNSGPKKRAKGKRRGPPLSDNDQRPLKQQKTSHTSETNEKGDEDKTT